MSVVTTSSVCKEVANTYIDWYARSAKAWEKRIEETTRPSALVSWAWQCEYCQCLASHEASFCDRCGAPPPAGILVASQPQYEDRWCGKPISKDERYKKMFDVMEDYSGKHDDMVDAMGWATALNWRI